MDDKSTLPAQSGPSRRVSAETGQGGSREDAQDEERTASVTTYVTPTERGRLDEAAFYQGLGSRSELVRELIYAYLHGDINIPEQDTN